MIASFLTITLVSTTAATAAGFCSYTGLTKYTWDGGGDGTTWDQAANWSPNVVPGTTSGGGTDYVCISNAGHITMTTNRAELVAFDIRGTTLTMNTNSQIFVYGNQSTQPSTIRSGASIVMDSSNTLGGSGKINVLGTLDMHSSDGYANTLSTRICGIDTSTCGGPVSGTPGLLAIASGGQLVIDGGGPGPSDLGGINLKDQYQIQDKGLIELSNLGFISADYGTSTKLLPNSTGDDGTFEILNDGGYYEGSQFFNLTSLSTFVNNGVLEKVGGTGTSVITATYSAPQGSVVVESGTLVLPDGPATPATVAAGQGIGSGLCPDGSSTLGCQPVATPSDDQTDSVQLSPNDTGGATVAFHQLATKSTSSDIAQPLQVDTTGLNATASSPAILTLRYDASVLGGRHQANLTIYRKEGTAAYVQVQNCLSNGNPPSGQNACVDRRGISGVSSRDLSDGDALIVIRTQSTSRWVAR